MSHSQTNNCARNNNNRCTTGIISQFAESPCMDDYFLIVFQNGYLPFVNKLFTNPIIAIPSTLAMEVLVNICLSLFIRVAVDVQIILENCALCGYANDGQTSSHQSIGRESNANPTIILDLLMPPSTPSFSLFTILLVKLKPHSSTLLSRNSPPNSMTSHHRHHPHLNCLHLLILN